MILLVPVSTLHQNHTTAGDSDVSDTETPRRKHFCLHNKYVKEHLMTLSEDF